MRPGRSPGATVCGMTRPLLADAFGHHAWATTTLIDACLRLDPEQLQPSAIRRDRDPVAVERRSLTPSGGELLAGAEVVDVAELDVGHRAPRGDGDAEAVRRQRAPRIERAVDWVDHDPYIAAFTEGDLTPLLRDRDKRGAVASKLLQLDEDRVLATAIDHQAAIAALAHPFVLGTRLAPWCRREQPPLNLDDPAANSQPVCG